MCKACGTEILALPLWPSGGTAEAPAAAQPPAPRLLRSLPCAERIEDKYEPFWAISSFALLDITPLLVFDQFSCRDRPTEHLTAAAALKRAYTYMSGRGRPVVVVT